ncbi:MAG: cell surface protein SprA, partial [Chitinophagales bacterium]|nr:cell surface protein SprA [Chitinophagales bacterium]
GQFFRDNYETSTSTLPVINSQATITNIEVWVTNRSNATVNVRDIIALADLGEHKPFSNQVNPTGPYNQTHNEANDLHYRIKGEEKYRSINTSVNALRSELGLTPLQDFEKTYARKLAPTEYTLFNQQGFISLNSALGPNEVLAVAYQYTYNGQIFQVGDFARDIPAPDTTSATPARLLFLKMLKGTSVRPQLPIWDLMMKNVYSLGAYQIQSQNFKLDIFYNDPGGGQKRYIPKGNLQGTQLLRVMNLDRLNNNGDPQPDGIFDFVQPYLIIPSNGKVYFPVLEPFGSHLEKQMKKAGDDKYIPTYVYNQLYDSTQVIAQQFPEFNRFVLKGTYQSSSSSRINLGAFGLPQGSVKVSLNGQPLQEGIDYTVEYGIGQVQIQEHVLRSGGQIKVDFENNSLFGLQQKNFMGSRMEYRLSDRFKAGATIMNLSERPFTKKVNFGEDPIDNMMLGGDVKYSTDLPFLTKLVDKLPFYSTKEMSNMSMYAEVAHLKPSHYSSIGEEGVVYLDDFEGASSGYNIGTPSISWKLASTPRGTVNGQGKKILLEGDFVNDTKYGYNRAKLAWYSIQNYIWTNSGPEWLLKDEEQKNSLYARNYEIKDVYPAKQNANINSFLPTFDLAFYPNQRGQYNYEFSQGPTLGVSKGINLDGTLKDPASRWGGIQRALDNTNFEQSNFEFIQFWMLDPFLERENNSGDLYFNLGTISEDVLRDSRMSYENGLVDINGAQRNQVDQTVWSWVPRTPSLVNAFDNNPSMRQYQDVGFDGVSDTNERIKYAEFLNKAKANLSPTAYALLEQDPSSDNFKFFLDEDFSNAKASVLQMHKQNNGLENNSPVNNTTSIPESNGNQPDNEDLNRDNTLNENEEYFQYRIPLFPRMDVGNHPYIASVYTTPGKSDKQGRNPRWIQFKIPIKKYDNKIGGIQDFRNIQFIRMFMTNFQDSAVLRMVDLQFLRNQWRTYEKSLQAGTDYIPTDNNNTTEFTTNGVNLEENGSKDPVSYVVPAGIPREVGVGQTRNIIQLNEQALNLQFCNLKDGDARACFKNFEFDFRKYDRLKMFIHAESRPSVAPLNDKDVSSFLRIGTDFSENYYEYEIPMLITKSFKPTDPLNVSDSERRIVWPTGNEVDLVLEELITLKRERNKLGIALNVPYTKVVNGRNMTIIGNPDIGLIKTIMLGVRNRALGDPFNFKAEDDGLSKCGEIWVNELRLSGLNEQGGTASLANINFKIADLGTVSISGDMHTIGFGQIEQRVDQRYRDFFYQYGINTNLNLGKFLPKVVGLQMPFFAQYSRSVSTPEFDPFTLDIKYVDAADDIQLRHGADSADNYLASGQTIDIKRGFSFANVRIAPETKQKHPHVWDIQNFTFGYAFTSRKKSDPFIASDWVRNYTGEVNYAFAGSPKYIEPLKGLFKKDIKMLRLVKDINFNLFPSSFSFGNKLDRRFGMLQQRSLPGEVGMTPNYDKYFTWDRNYGFAFNPFKSVSLAFSAGNKARIDEPPGGLDTKKDVDSIWNNLYSFGRTTNYNHTLTANYNVPFAKIPFLDFVSSTIGYNSSFNWIAGPLKYDEPSNKIIANPQGNMLNTTQGEKANLNLNLDQLYNKSLTLKKYNQPQSVADAKDRINKNKNIKVAKDKLAEDLDREKTNLKKLKEDLKKLKADETLADTLKKQSVKDMKKQIKSKKNQIKEIKKNYKTKKYIAPKAVNSIIQPLLSIKRISLNYDVTKSTILPGYMPKTRFFGIENRMEEPLHWQIAAGKQPGMPLLAPVDKYERTRWLDAAAGNGWITPDTTFNQQFQQQYTKTISGTATIEPFRDLKIDLTIKSSYTNRYSEIFKKRTEDGPYEHLTPLESGTYSISDINIFSSFDKLDTFGVNQVFLQFEENRKIINERLRAENPFSSNQPYIDPLDSNGKVREGYTLGYGPSQQDVVIPAFLAAYRNKNARTIGLNPFSHIPLPNWNLTYNGLMKIPFIKKSFKNLTMKHGYTSETQLTQYNTEVRYQGGGTSLDPSAIDTLTNNYYPYYFIPSVVITENLNPLIGFDFTMVNNVTGRFEIKSSRTLSLGFNDYTMTENAQTTITVGAGYKVKGFKNEFKFLGLKIKLKNEMNFGCDFSWADNAVVNHKLGPGLNIYTQGMIKWNIAPKIDYMVNNNLNISLYFNHNRSYPKISNSFVMTNTSFGLRLRFSLSQN